MSDGLLINGSQLTRGINKVNKLIPVTGGMAGDGARFCETYVIANDVPSLRTIVPRQLFLPCAAHDVRIAFFISLMLSGPSKILSLCKGFLYIALYPGFFSVTATAY